MATGSFNLEVEKITFFRNSLSSTQTVTGSGSSGWETTMAAAKTNAMNSAITAAHSKSASYSPVSSGYGSSNSVTGSVIGVEYSRWNNQNASATVTGTTSQQNGGAGLTLWKASATASGTATARRYTYSAAITVKFDPDIEITNPDIITKATISLTPTSVTGSINNCAWKLAVKNTKGTISSFISDLKDYVTVEIPSSSASSTNLTCNITSLVKTMVSTGNRQIYIICSSIPGSNTSFGLTTASVTFPSGVSYDQSKVVTDEETGLQAAELESQNYIATPGQMVTLTWGAAKDGLGTTVKGFELSYVENGQTIVVNNAIPKTQTSITYPASEERKAVREFRIRALAEQTAEDLQGEYVSRKIKTNSLPTAPNFQITPSTGFSCKTADTKTSEYLERRYWFGSANNEPTYKLSLNETLSSDPDTTPDDPDEWPAQSLSYKYYINGEEQKTPFSTESLIKIEPKDKGKETIYKIEVFDNLEQGPSTIIKVWQNNPITVTVPSADNDSAPYRDADGNPYWIYFNGTAEVKGGHGQDYKYSWTIDDNQISDKDTITDYLLLTKDVGSSIPLKLEVTDGADTATFSYTFYRPTPASFHSMNQNNHDVPNVSGVNESYFGNFIGFETETEVETEAGTMYKARDEGVKITLNGAPFVKKETSGGIKYWAWHESSLSNYERDTGYVFKIVQTWGNYTVTESFTMYRTLDYKDFLSGLSLYKNDDGSYQVFYPLPRKDVSTPPSYSIVDGEGLPVPNGYEGEPNQTLEELPKYIKFNDLSSHGNFAARSGISTSLNQVFKVEIWQKEQSGLQTLTLQGRDTGARLGFEPSGDNQEIQIITWGDGGKNLVKWSDYFNITSNTPINATMRISIMNLFGEVFSTERDFKIDFSALLKDSTYDDVGVLLTKNSYSSIKKLKSFSVFEDETFKFDFSATSYYAQEITAHVKIAGKEVTAVLAKTEESIEDYSVSYHGSVIFNVPPILSSTEESLPEIWLSALGLDENITLDQPELDENTTLNQPLKFNLRRTNIVASDLAIADILAERLVEIDPTFMGQEYINAYRYSVSLKGQDFGGDGTYNSFTSCPVYTILFSQTADFANTQEIIKITDVPYPELSFVFSTNYRDTELAEGVSNVVGTGQEGDILGLTSTLRQGYIKIDYQVENDFEKDNSFEKNSISGKRIYSKTLGIMAVFALKPTVYYGANRLGLNTNSLVFQDSILEVNNKDDSKNRIYFTNTSSSQDKNMLMIDLKSGESYGFIFLGTNWDDGNDPNYTVPIPAEGKEF